mmetsp:Transcript_27953/g.60565  ORF Transcript_27953/g.60565 Transcript_27953/m.60565 type:complete len:269 (-) Transcript_27953:54-860(-)
MDAFGSCRRLKKVVQAPVWRLHVPLPLLVRLLQLRRPRWLRLLATPVPRLVGLFRLATECLPCLLQPGNHLGPLHGHHPLPLGRPVGPEWHPPLLRRPFLRGCRGCCLTLSRRLSHSLFPLRPLPCLRLVLLPVPLALRVLLLPVLVLLVLLLVLVLLVLLPVPPLLALPLVPLALLCKPQPRPRAVSPALAPMCHCPPDRRPSRHHTDDRHYVCVAVGRRHRPPPLLTKTRRVRPWRTGCHPTMYDRATACPATPRCSESLLCPERM